ncbi:unnamed protein product [Arabis nemorensis]|uniref:DUF4283 domain-containing protein n=1 Tax=Arabis nemorensis TaxID=586526 RepID=A0A565C712_9BRAS|nr:unnamed protein product [Arabis nemorensis]
MSQLARNNNGENNVARLSPIRMPWFDNSELIRSLGKTRVGRVTNPAMQNREDDILEVLKTEPFSFNQWMVSIVRWEPVIRNNYPSDITFWVRIIGVPVEISTDRDFRRIGNELGTVREVDEVNAMVKVTIDSTIPLCFEISVQFVTGGDMADVKMEYEKLLGYCATRFSLCHDKESCPESDLHEDDVLVDEVKHMSESN